MTDETLTPHRRLRGFQEKLLDLSKRNRLLNFRTTRATTVRIVDELPGEIFRLLVKERKSLSFLAAPERRSDVPEIGPQPDDPTPPETSGEGPPHAVALPVEAGGPDLLEEGRGGEEERSQEGGDAESGEPVTSKLPDGTPTLELGPVFTREFQPYRPELVSERHRDRMLQTDLDPERLDYNLLRTYQKATSTLEEQGHNTLFLTLGALEWHEDSSPGRSFLAPLILVPVELRRRSPRRPFQLFMTDEDPVFNPTLAMKLDRELNVRAPDVPDDLVDWEVQEAFASLAEGVRHLEGWRVLNDIYLGLFSFTKFLMYKDLETHADVFAQHRLIRHLCSGPESDDVGADGESRATLTTSDRLDEVLDPRNTFQILDADSSQQRAILAVKNGADLVLEGPPGTGKSQTITNIVAECLAAGKRVLFVSEKMAALEVVYNRLRQAGLGDFCLELHSRHTSKREVAEELARTLALGGEEKAAADHEELSQLESLRDRLNCYVESLSTPLEPLGLSPFEALARSIALEKAVEVPSPMPQVGTWTRTQLDEALQSLQSLAGAMATVRERFPDPRAHPWRGSSLEELSYQGSVAIRDALENLLEALSVLEREGAALSEALGETPPSTSAAADELAVLARAVAISPNPSRESLRDPAWNNPGEEIADLIRSCRRYQDLLAALDARWSPALLDAELEAILARQRSQRGLLRFFRPSWWRDRRTLRGLVSEALPAREVLLVDLERAKEARLLRDQLRDAAERGRVLFGDLWANEETDVDQLEHYADWATAFQRHLRGAEADRRIELALGGVSQPAALHREAERLASDVVALRSVWKDLREAACLSEEETLEGELSEQSFHVLRSRLQEMASQMETLHDWGRKVAAEKICRQAGLDGFLKTAGKLAVSPDDLLPGFERLFWRCWLDLALSERPELRRFSRQEHERVVRDFRELDLKQLALTRKRLRSLLKASLPDASWEPSARSELGILQREVRRKRGHKPIRKLFQLIPHALGRLKPCCLMSPLSVAQFLDPRLQRFDVVVFDEASQIAPEDALGAIARGEQLVVVGDSRQLPPTSFFRTDTALEDDRAEHDEVPDLESILDECAVAGLPRLMLRWHYRSRHESLITFSNMHFYEGRLHTFPACSEELGVSFVHLPEAVYDRGRTQTNRVEAERVARAVIEHFRSQPQMSLGVGAFSQAQQTAILDRLEELRRHDESLEEFFAEGRPEHFFVKNLENIQGDERDAILLSVGYGRDARGRLSLNFGPLNKAGGERRLNVLVTRARRRLVIFSSIRGDDIDLARTTSAGARLLKRYLDYAEKGPRGLGREPVGDDGKPPASPLGETFIAALEERDMAVEWGVGNSDVKIGLVLSDRQAPARRVLGIEWDGPTYQGASTARDRDRLRQQVLEGLGWRFHRVWVPEWHRNPNGELERLLESYEAARSGNKEPEILPLLDRFSSPTSAHSTDTAARAPATENAGRATSDARTGPLPLYELAELQPAGEPEDLDAAREEIHERLIALVEVESPIHRDEAARRIASCWGVTRLSRSVETKIASAVAAVGEQGRLRVVGDFLWSPKQQSPQPRCRRGPGVPREPELIAIEEISQAILLVLEREFRLSRGDLIAQIVRLLGFQRTGSKLRQRIDDAVERVLATQQAVEGEGGVKLRVPRSGGRYSGRDGRHRS